MTERKITPTIKVSNNKKNERSQTGKDNMEEAGYRKRMNGRGQIDRTRRKWINGQEEEKRDKETGQGEEGQRDRTRRRGTKYLIDRTRRRRTNRQEEEKRDK